MKLLLTSAGITNESISNALHKLVGKDFSQVGFAYIPTASNVEDGDKGWLIDDFNQIRKLSPAFLDIVDISALSQKIWLPRLQKADVIFFGGGNTFHLMYWLKKSGLDKILPALLETKIYVGISAGSMVVSDSIFLTSDKPIFNEDRLGNIDDTGLNYINFYIRPHLNSPYFPKATENVVAESAKSTTKTIYALDDQSVVSVDGNKTEVISEGIFKVFNK